jgi:hypothetical protein
MSCAFGLLTALVAVAGPPAVAQEVWEKVDRVVAVGDIHGDYGQLRTVLRDASLVDDRDRWAGGRTHLVQVGDLLDRGPDSRKVMDLLMRLEKEAKKAGGAVHCLVGNHEAMNVLGDLRYTTPEEFAAFKTSDSTRLREALLTRVLEDRRAQGKAPLTQAERQEWEKEHPLGFVEHRLAFSPRGEYGSWIVRQNAVVRVGDSLFLHGGLSPKYADLGLRELNDRIRQELRDGDHQNALLANDPEGPLWFRGLAGGDPALASHLEAVLRRHGCRRMVVGHTVTEGGLVMPRYAGRLIQIDVGMTKVFGGPPAALVIEGDRAFALHRGRRLALPEGDGEPLLRYVRAVAALEPDPSRLAKLIAGLEASLSVAPAQP